MLIMLNILIDADACPVTKIVEEIAEEKQIPLTILCDTSHIMESNYAKVITVSKGIDSVDLALMNRANKGDIIVTQDYGVATMALGKRAYAIHPCGKWYTNDNIDQMLFERHLSKKMRHKNKRYHGKGPRKRTEEDDIRFQQSFLRLIDFVNKENTSPTDNSLPTN